MKVLIVEDEELAHRRLQKLLIEIEPGVEMAGHADSVVAAVELINRFPDADLLFLDIELADGKSFEIFRQVEWKKPVIFTTAYDEYALQAFELHSIDYLLKPIEKTSLSKAIHKYKELFHQKESHPTPVLRELITQLSGFREGNYKNRFLVKGGSKLIPVPVADIAWFLAHEKMVFLVKQDGSRYVIDYTIEELQQVLNPAMFFRTGRSLIVHLQAVESLQTSFNGKLLLQLNPAPFTGEEVVVSRERAQEFKEWLDR